jgi:hypothetical protein
MAGTAFEALQFLSLLIVVATLLLLMGQIKRDKTKRLWVFPMAIWMDHAIVFYTVLILNRYYDPIQLPNEFFTNWSATLRLHGYLTIFVIELFRWIQSRKEH